MGSRMATAMASAIDRPMASQRGVPSLSSDACYGASSSKEKTLAQSLRPSRSVGPTGVWCQTVPGDRCYGERDLASITGLPLNGTVDILGKGLGPSHVEAEEPFLQTALLPP